MNHSRPRVLLLMIALSGLVGVANADTVISASKRQVSLAQAKELLEEKTFVLNSKNPFNPEGFGENQSGDSPGPISIVPSGPRSTKELLQAIGASLKPSGSVTLGGEPTLIFGEKRVKAGGFLTITFEGSEYTLEIVSIDRPNFTLRLNREEFTRPIK
jgi:hypothetical protein